MRLGVDAALVDGVLVVGDIEIVDGRVAQVGLESAGGRGVAVPGFVDLHVHGFGDVDFATADLEDYRRAGDALLRSGVTAFQPSFLTAPPDDLLAALALMPSESIGPRVIGAHLEGPFISERKLGMHPASARLDPDLALAERFLAAGHVTHMTLAPELAGATELMDLLLAHGVTVALGHTDATAEEAHAAFDRGAVHVTHLYNAMRPFAHRDPGLAGAALWREDVTVELILDGNHVAEDAVRVAWRAARGRIVLVTDSIGATTDGRRRVGPVEVEVRDGVVRGSAGELAGSVLTMPEAIRALVHAGASFEQAVDAATRVPARAARRSDIGTLSVGSTADVVVLDGDIRVERVVVGGIEHSS
jgi:N-acetylglucosamine-6-phosphate deacetylase